MKILHTADLHLGQNIYQCYSREEEHQHFFYQLESWCKEHRPDALLLSGDIFDIQQPNANTRRLFNEQFVKLHKAYPEMAIVVTAGNHDSASRIHADSAVWSLGNVSLIGAPPTIDSAESEWCDDYIIALPTGFIIALPYMAVVRRQTFQTLLDHVANRNSNNLPVVMMAHLAVSNSDVTGHSDIGKVQIQNPKELGEGYDYLALGHIHRSQTLGRSADDGKPTTYPAGVLRYSGSVLHVSCDETYPHSVSLVEIDHHGGSVTITPLRIDELLHFYILPEKQPASSCEEALDAVQQFVEDGRRGYFRLQIDKHVALPADFTTRVYSIIENYPDVRYNPKAMWTGETAVEQEEERPTFDVAELQQMTDPMDFISKTITQYPDLTKTDANGKSIFDQMEAIFDEIRQEMKALEEETQKAKSQKKGKKTSQSDDTSLTTDVEQ